MRENIGSVHDSRHGGSDQSILLAAMKMHNGGQPFEVDACFGPGMMYRGGVPEPLRKFDINLTVPGVEQADCRSLPFEAGTVGSIVCDLPFAFGNHGTNKPSNKTPRGYSDPATLNASYSHLHSYEELSELYQRALTEFARILTHKPRWKGDQGVFWYSNAWIGRTESILRSIAM